MEHTPLIPAVKSRNNRTSYSGRKLWRSSLPGKPLFLENLENSIAALWRDTLVELHGRWYATGKFSSPSLRPTYPQAPRCTSLWTICPTFSNGDAILATTCWSRHASYPVLILTPGTMCRRWMCLLVTLGTNNEHTLVLVTSLHSSGFTHWPLISWCGCLEKPHPLRCVSWWPANLGAINSYSHSFCCLPGASTLHS